LNGTATTAYQVCLRNLKISEATFAYKQILRQLHADSGEGIRDLAMALRMHPVFLYRAIYCDRAGLSITVLSGVSRILGYRVTMSFEELPTDTVEVSSE